MSNQTVDRNETDDNDGNIVTCNNKTELISLTNLFRFKELITFEKTRHQQVVEAFQNHYKNIITKICTIWVSRVDNLPFECCLIVGDDPYYTLIWSEGRFHDPIECKLPKITKVRIKFIDEIDEKLDKTKYLSFRFQLSDIEDPNLNVEDVDNIDPSCLINKIEETVYIPLYYNTQDKIWFGQVLLEYVNKTKQTSLCCSYERLKSEHIVYSQFNDW